MPFYYVAILPKNQLEQSSAGNLYLNRSYLISQKKNHVAFFGTITIVIIFTRYEGLWFPGASTSQSILTQVRLAERTINILPPT